MSGNDFAFPVLDRTQTPNETTQLRLTKREWFAAMAIQGILAAGEVQPNESALAAQYAIQNADALLAELAKW